MFKRLMSIILYKEAKCNMCGIKAYIPRWKFKFNYYCNNCKDFDEGNFNIYNANL